MDAHGATWPEINTVIEDGCVAVMAFGSHEQHGPHCPLSTDTILAGGLAKRVADAINAILLPPVPYGDAWDAAHFPGTVSLSFSTVQAIVMDVATSLKNSGVRALIIVNGHYWNRAPLELAAREMMIRHGFPVLHLPYPGMEKVAAEVLESAPAFPFYHADEMETSMLLALEPESVRMDRAVAEYPDYPPTLGFGQHFMEEFSKSGVFGDPRSASAEKGERLLAGLLEECLKVIRPFLAGLPG